MAQMPCLRRLERRFRQVGTRLRAGRRLPAVLACMILLWVPAACAEWPEPNISPTTTASSNSGRDEGGDVAIFTPSDGITLSRHTPLNKWTVFTPELREALQAGHIEASAITGKQSANLEAQSRDVQDYLVGHVADAQDSATASSSDSQKHRATTIVIAPAIRSDDTTRQYGDYISARLTWRAGRNAAAERLVDTLRLAQDSGMHVILVASSIQGFTPNMLVTMSTAREIGQIQAKQLVSKLALTTASRDNPKHIEVLLPYQKRNGDGSATDHTFVSQAFAGIWEVLGPYFKDGRVVSPSDTLDGRSTADDWRQVAFDAAKESDVEQEMNRRLGTGGSEDHGHTRIDGVLAMNDFIASGVITTLSRLGYTGSAADINPEISISGIVSNITGRRDLPKRQVPDPERAPRTESSGNTGKTRGEDREDSDESTAESGESTAAAWPIVTGFGGYIGNIPQIVNGQQWMTAIEDRKNTASRIAEACIVLNAGRSLSSLKSLTHTGTGETPMLETDLLPVSASNLKSALIDSGYVSAADAGL